MLNHKLLNINLANTHLKHIRWRWVFALGVATNMACSITIGIVIAIYAMVLAVLSGGEPDILKIQTFAEQVSDIGSSLLSTLFLVGGSVWIGRKTGRLAVQHALWMVLIAALVGQLFAYLFGAPYLTWVTLFWFCLVITLGGLGGYLGQIAFAEQEALYRVSRAISQADTPQAIVRAIYEQFASADVSHIALWQLHTQPEETHPTKGKLLALCPAQRAMTVSDMPLVGVATLARLQPESPLLLERKELPTPERVKWEKMGQRSLLLLPLTTGTSSWVGLLTIASSRGRLPNRTKKAYLTISSQVTLALENWRLMEEAKQAGVLQERQRLAHEIHDTIAQGLISIVTHLEAAEQALPQEKPPTLLPHFEHARRTARESLTQARRVVNDLRPQALEEAPFLDAIRRVVTRCSAENGIAAELHITGESQTLHPQIEITLLRATQEALANVQKHAHASQVTVTFSYMEDCIVLDVQDDGIGFNYSPSESGTTSGGFGLTAMRERVSQWHGQLLIESAPGEGTTLVIQVPIFEAEAREVR